MSLTVDSIGKTITGQGTAASEKQSSKICALQVIRQLYHYGLIEAYNGTLKVAKPTDSLMFDVELNLELVAQLNTCIRDNNIDYIEVPHRYEDLSISLYDDTTRHQPTPESDEPPVNYMEWSPPKEGYCGWTQSALKSDSNWSTMSLDYVSLILKNQRLEQLKNNEYSQLILRERENLPIFNQKGVIIRHIEDNTVSIIKGSTGCGKSTQVCQYILDEYLMSARAGCCNIVVTQPRRIAAIALAERIAFERSETLGYSVGYAVRYDTCFPRPFGSIVLMTVGTLLKRLSNGLIGVSHLIIDEVHERDIYTDFIMIIVHELIKKYPNIRVILMSATIDTKNFSEYFNNAPVLEVTSVLHDVKTFFLEDVVNNTVFRKNVTKIKPDDANENNLMIFENDENCNLIVSDEYSQFVKDSLSKISEREIDYEIIAHIIKYVDSLKMAGSILIFMPGWNDIVTLIDYLMHRSSFEKAKYCILPLHSQLPKADQKKVFDAASIGQTKLIISTNIAESSITINDVVFVIDSCKVKLKYFHTSSNIITYNTVWASQSSLNQRKGRAGRVRNGYYFCLCSKARYERLEKYTMPEMQRTSLDEIALSIKYLNLGGIRGFLSLAMEPPPIDAIVESEVMLKRINALNTKSEITPLGKMLAKLPLEPRLGKMLLFGCIFECGNELITLAANSSTLGQVFNYNTMRSNGMCKETFSGIRNSDHLTMLSVYNTWENFLNKDQRKANNFCSDHNLSFSTMQLTYDARRHIYQRILELGIPEKALSPINVNMNRFDDDLDVVVALLCTALYPNVYFQKGKRIVKTSGNKYGLIHKTSQNCNANKRDYFLSPFFVYSEKLHSSLILCKQTSMVSPTHLLLFGCRKAVLVNGYVQLDDWLNIKIDPNIASKILSLRPVLERLVMEAAVAPDNIFHRSGKDYMLIGTIKELCKMTAHVKEKPRIVLIRNNPNLSLVSRDYVNFRRPEPSFMLNSKLSNVSISRRGLGKRVYADSFQSNLEEGEQCDDDDDYESNFYPKRQMMMNRLSGGRGRVRGVVGGHPLDKMGTYPPRGMFRHPMDNGGGYSMRGFGHPMDEIRDDTVSGYPMSGRDRPLMIGGPQPHAMRPPIRSPYHMMEPRRYFGPPELYENIVTVDDHNNGGDSSQMSNTYNDNDDNFGRVSPSDDLHKYPWQRQQPPQTDRLWIPPNQSEPCLIQYPKNPWQPPSQQSSGQPQSLLNMDLEPPSFENRPMLRTTSDVNPYPFMHRKKENARPLIGVSGMSYSDTNQKRGSKRGRGGRGRGNFGNRNWSKVNTIYID